MTEAEQRAAVIAEARRWIGTPYHNGADVRGAGVDCGMLIVRVFVDTGLTPPFDPRPYPPDWHLHRGEEKYLGFIFAHCAEVTQPEPGDVVVFRYGRCYSHGGIVTQAQKGESLSIVHAFWPARIVMEEDISHNLELADPARKRRCFSYWAKQERQVEMPIGPRISNPHVTKERAGDPRSEARSI
jgi:cell wall-associated NlpC family hydrolase